MKYRSQLIFILILLSLCFVTLFVGLLTPCMTIQPGLGTNRFVRFIVKALPPYRAYVQPKSYSIIQGLINMARDGNVAIAVVVFLFSVIFPLLKLTLFGVYTVAKLKGETLNRLSDRALELVHKLGRFSMLDVFVGALVVLAIMGLPGNTKVFVNFGFWSFTASVLLSLFVSLQIEKHARQEWKLSSRAASD